MATSRATWRRLSAESRRLRYVLTASGADVFLQKAYHTVEALPVPISLTRTKSRMFLVLVWRVGWLCLRSEFGFVLCLSCLVILHFQ